MHRALVGQPLVLVEVRDAQAERLHHLHAPLELDELGELLDPVGGRVDGAAVARRVELVAAVLAAVAVVCLRPGAVSVRAGADQLGGVDHAGAQPAQLDQRATLRREIDVADQLVAVRALERDDAGELRGRRQGREQAALAGAERQGRTARRSRA